MSFPKYIAKFPNILYNFQQRFHSGGMCLKILLFLTPSERQKKTTNIQWIFIHCIF